MNIEKTADEIAAVYALGESKKNFRARVAGILAAALGPQPGERLYTTHEVAKLLQVDSSTIAKWIDSGKLVAFRTPGGHRRVRESEFRAFCERYQMPVTGKLAA